MNFMLTQAVWKRSLMGVLVSALALSAVNSRAESPLDPKVLHKSDAEVEKVIDEGNIPGGVVWVQHGGEHYTKAYGKRSLVPVDEVNSQDTIYDLASLTKVIAGTPAMMKLIEDGKVKLDEKVSTYIPEFKGDGKENITIRELLTH